ncbi:EAL domain-containing protein [Ruminococcus sp.]
MITDEYTKALEKFISAMQNVDSPTPDFMADAMADICRALRIGKVEMLVYDNEAAEHLGLANVRRFYNCGSPCLGEYVSKRIITADEQIAVYRVTLQNDTEPWTADERSRIDIFIMLLSTFNGKFRLLTLTHRLTFFDSDLNMYNHRHFMMMVRKLYKEETIDNFAAVYFNLKRFSIVNQQIGRENGTRVMKRFIGMLESLTDCSDECVCRIGGDNFITLIKQDKLDDVLKLLGGTGITYDESRSERIFISATAGVYVIPDMDSFILPTDIMDRVSMAFYLARGSAKQDVVFFDDALLARSKQNNEITACFPKAIEKQEFLVYYQPKVDIRTRTVAGSEALCRWFHNGRLVPPAEFIPVLEQGRDICKLDFYMLDTVCRDIRRWLDTGIRAVRVSVNLSRRHLSDMDLLSHIVDIIDKHKVPHEYIEIELTETTTDVEFKDLKRIISGLQEVGIATSVDDFGIGYSSLNLIKEVPWDVLKLDKSLLPDYEKDDPIQKSIMFRHIVAMGREMGVECIAEGVETKEQVRLLEENRCDLAQGFYFDRPLPIKEFETRLIDDFKYDR